MSFHRNSWDDDAIYIALIRHKGKQVRFHIKRPTDASIQLYSTKPENDFEDDNPGTVMIGFSTQLLPGMDKILEVELHPEI